MGPERRANDARTVTLGGRHETRYVRCCRRRQFGVGRRVADFVDESQTGRGRDLEQSSPVVADLEGVGYASGEHDKAAWVGIEAPFSAHDMEGALEDVIERIWSEQLGAQRFGQLRQMLAELHQP